MTEDNTLKMNIICWFRAKVKLRFCNVYPKLFSAICVRRKLHNDDTWGPKYSIKPK